MQDGQGSSALNSSMTDLMTSLAVIFILLLVASLNNSYRQGQIAKSSVLDELKKVLSSELTEFKKDGFILTDDPKDPLGLILIVPDGLLNFKKNDARVPLRGKEFLYKIIPKISQAVCSAKFRPSMSSIVIEGHTDSDGGDLMNLTLSQSRSMSVVSESVAVLRARLPRQADCFTELVSATGRGEMELVSERKMVGRRNFMFENKDKSRRVVFKMKVRSQEEKILKSITR